MEITSTLENILNISKIPVILFGGFTGYFIVSQLNEHLTKLGLEKIEDYMHKKEISKKITTEVKRMSDYLSEKANILKTWQEDLSMIPYYSEAEY